MGLTAELRIGKRRVLPVQCPWCRRRRARLVGVDDRDPYQVGDLTLCDSCSMLGRLDWNYQGDLMIRFLTVAETLALHDF